MGGEEGGFLDLPNHTSSPCDSRVVVTSHSPHTSYGGTYLEPAEPCQSSYRPEDKAEWPRRDHEKTGQQFSDFSTLQNHLVGLLTHTISTAPPQRFWLRSGKGLRICLSNDFSGDADHVGPGTTPGEPLSWAVPQACLWTSISTRRVSSWSNRSAKPRTRTLLVVVQGLRIHLPMQGTWVSSLVQELRSHTSWCN